MIDFWQSLRHTVLRLLKSPGFTVVAVLTLTLGIGATTAIYTVVQNVLLEPLPYPQAERIVVIQEKNPEAGFPRFSISPLNFRDYRALSSSFEAMAARTGAGLALTGRGDGPARRLSGRAVTSDFLRVFGLAPLHGRDFTPEDDRPGAPPVVILSHQLWQELGAGEDLLGRDLRLDGRPTTVVGVLPPGHFPGTDALVPAAFDYENISRGAHFLLGFGRLKAGVTVEEARRELETVAANLASEFPNSNHGWGAIVDPYKERVVENIRPALWTLVGAVAMVLLIACTNVANLSLARVASRQRETALRSALGAGRWRLVREQLGESVLVALVAGAAGVFLAERATAWLVTLEANPVPRSEAIGVDAGVLSVALGLAVASAVLFGLLPAVRSVRLDLGDALKDGDRGQAGDRRSLRLRSALVLGEVALAVVLLVASGLLIRTLTELLDVEAGFDPDPVWVAGLSLPDAPYDDDAKRAVFWQRLVEEAAALPGVSHASTVMPMPLSGSDYVLQFYLEGKPIPPPNQELNSDIRYVTPGYFETVGIPLLAGRDFTFADNADASAALVVNQSAVERFWGGAEALGKRISFGRPDNDDVTWFTVVGVVGDVHHGSLEEEAQPAFYRATLQDAPSFSTIVLNTSGDPAALAAPLRDLVRRLDPNLPLVREQRASDLVASSLAAPRFNATMLAIFAGLALVLAAVGVFGVVSYVVTQRHRELGVRVALGARSQQIVALVLGQGMRPVAAGIGLGIAGALVACLLLRRLVYGVGVWDPGTFAFVAVLLTAVAALACLIPALRATRVDPMAALREE